MPRSEDTVRARSERLRAKAIERGIPKASVNHGKHPERLTPEQFRKAVWERDGGFDRSTGQPVWKGDPNLHRCGSVCHLRGRRVMPEWAVDPTRAVLLSEANHIKSDHRGGNRLKLTDDETGERAFDATRRIRFTLYDRTGKVVWSRVS